MMDGETIDPSNYTILVDENGKLAVDFTEEFLKTLAPGSHFAKFWFGSFNYGINIAV